MPALATPRRRSFCRALRTTWSRSCWLVPTASSTRLNSTGVTSGPWAVVLTSAGYPGSYEKGKVITGIADAEAMENVTVYHAGTAVVDGQLVTNGGRVLAVTALGDTFENARNLAYEACEKIDFEGKTLRHDIGLRALRDAWDA